MADPEINSSFENIDKIDTFSANSLKLLEKSTEEFKLKYIDNLYFAPDNTKAKSGQNLHNFLYFYLKNFNTSKIEAAFTSKDKDFIEKIQNFDAVKILKSANKKQIEQPFLINCTNFYLTGRFDAILIEDNNIKIYDWKTLNLPENPEDDIQTIVYLFAASKLYKTKNISITYVSLTKNESREIKYNSACNYFEKISKIVQKL